MVFQVLITWIITRYIMFICPPDFKTSEQKKRIIRRLIYLIENIMEKKRNYNFSFSHNIFERYPFFPALVSNCLLILIESRLSSLIELLNPSTKHGMICPNAPGIIQLKSTCEDRDLKVVQQYFSLASPTVYNTIKSTIDIFKILGFLS